MHYSMLSWKQRWPHFSPREMACRCCGELYKGDGPLPEELMLFLDGLEEVRERWGRPMVVNSGHRCRVHNAAVGGTAESRHLEIAADIAVPEEEQARFAKIAEEAGFTGIGVYPARGFVHIDMGTDFPRRWIG